MCPSFMELSDFLMYSGFGIILAGIVGAFYAVYKGYKSTDWSKVKRISPYAKFRQDSGAWKMNALEKTVCCVIVFGLFLVLLSRLV